MDCKGCLTSAAVVEERHRRTQQSNECWSSVPSEQDILLRHIRGHFPRSRQRRDRPTINKNLIEDRTRGPVHHMSYLFRLAIITPLSQGSHSVVAAFFLATRISVCHGTPRILSHVSTHCHLAQPLSIWQFRSKKARKSIRPTSSMCKLNSMHRNRSLREYRVATD